MYVHSSIRRFLLVIRRATDFLLKWLLGIPDYPHHIVGSLTGTASPSSLLRRRCPVSFHIREGSERPIWY